MKKILTVDDDMDITLFLRAILKNKYIVESASNGHEALTYLKNPNNKPDLILLDVEMPEMDGLTLKRKLDSDPKLQSLPVIFLSRKDYYADKVDSKNAPQFLNKPIDKEDLLYVLESFFYNK